MDGVLRGRERWLLRQPVQTLRAEAERHGVVGVSGLDTRALVRQILAHEQEDSATPGATAAPALGRRVNSGPLLPSQPQQLPQPRPEHLALDRRQQPQPQHVTAAHDSAHGVTDSHLRALMAQGHAVDLGSLHDQRRRLLRQQQQARSEQAQQTAQASHQEAYDYGPRSRHVEPARSNRLSHLQPQPTVTRGNSGALTRTSETEQQHRAHQDIRQQQRQQQQQQQQQQPQTQPQHYTAFQPPARSAAALLQTALRPTTSFPSAVPVGEAPVGFFAPSTLAPLAPAMMAQMAPAPPGTDQTTIDNSTALMTFTGVPTRAAGGPSVATAPPREHNSSSLNSMSVKSILSDPGAASDVVGRARTSSHNIQVQCSVCLEAFQPGEELRLLPCFHRFHVSCIDAWLARNPACPVCKHSILAN